MVSQLVALFTCLLLAVLASDADAQCYYYDGPCVYNKNYYEMFDMWETDDCETCFCGGEFGYECCSKFYVPTVYDHEKCTVFRDKNTCQTQLLDKEGNPCHALVGIL